MSVLGSAFNDTVTLGTILAVVISWDRNQSVLYAAFHGTFGWLYIFYLWFKGETL